MRYREFDEMWHQMTGPDRDELQPAALAIRTITGADGKVLKRYDLFAKEITLPNGSLQRYGPLKLW